MNPAKSILFRITIMLASVVAAVPSWSQEYPSRPIRIIAPFAAGGGSDILVRLIARRLTAKYGQSVVVDNRTGAGSVVATEILAKSQPDGYTLGVVTTSFVINPGLRKELPYDSLRDFAPITQMVSTDNILLVNPSSPITSVEKLISLAKTKPGSISYGSPGIGTAAHIATELLNTMAGIDLLHIPYKGSSLASIDVIGGRVNLLVTTLSSASQYINKGELRPLAVTGSKRVATLPDVPTLAESIPGYEASPFNGIIAPAQVRKGIIHKVAADIRAALFEPEIRARVVADGAEPVGSSPEEFRAFLKKEMAKWSKVIRESKAQAN
jgi:tripartite-type tricarboxylate transporter receptor subunit TctC